MKTDSFKNALNRAEGTIARASGGRRSWDPSALRETAIRAMRGDECRPGGDMSPGEYNRMAAAFRAIADRTSAAHKKAAASY